MKGLVCWADELGLYSRVREYPEACPRGVVWSGLYIRDIPAWAGGGWMSWRWEFS